MIFYTVVRPWYFVENSQIPDLPVYVFPENFHQKLCEITRSIAQLHVVTRDNA